MKRFKYTPLWLLLSVALSVIVTISFMEDIRIGEWTVKKAPIKEFILQDNKFDLLADSDINASDSAEIVGGVSSEEVVRTDSLPQNLFIFGDSMTFNLALRLAQYARQNGHVIHSVNWDSSNTKIWAEHDTLRYYINKYRPTQIFISLGSNEMYFRNPETRAPYVKKILEVIDTIPYVWIGPPNWKEDTGINDMLQRICKKELFSGLRGWNLSVRKIISTRHGKVHRYG